MKKEDIRKFLEAHPDNDLNLTPINGKNLRAQIISSFGAKVKDDQVAKKKIQKVKSIADDFSERERKPTFAHIPDVVIKEESHPKFEDITNQDIKDQTEEYMDGYLGDKKYLNDTYNLKPGDKQE